MSLSGKTIAIFVDFAFEDMVRSSLLCLDHFLSRK